MIVPMVAELLRRVERLPAVEEALHSLRSGGSGSVERSLPGLSGAAKPLVVALAAASLNRPVVCLVESNRRAEEFAEPLRFFLRALTGKPASRVSVFPSRNALPYTGLSPHAEICAARGVALWRWASGEADVLVAPIEAAIERLHSPQRYKNLALTLSRDDEVPLETLLEFLCNAGYERAELVGSPGQFAQRGGIVDIFSPETSRPVRLELLGDSVESIREFNVDSQRSIRPLERATILPLTDVPQAASASREIGQPADPANPPEIAANDSAGFTPGWELALAGGQRRESSLLALAHGAVLFQDEPLALADALQGFRARLHEAWKTAGEDPDIPASHFVLDEAEWDSTRGGVPCVNLERLALGDAPGLAVQTQPTSHYHGNVAAFMAELRSRVDSSHAILVAAPSTGELERLGDLCREYGLPYRVGELEDNATIARLAEEGTGGPSAVLLIKAPIREGVVFPECALAIYGLSDIFDWEAVPAPPRSQSNTAAFLGDFTDLAPGDFVVHVDHGIGQFVGLRQVNVDGAAGEFMLLRYADDARIYVPLARMDLIQRYRTLGGPPPTLDRLGSGVWEARKSRVRKSVDDLAERLLALYADRKQVAGHAFPADSPWQHEFADAFEFEETPDQKKAIDDTQRDLASELPMDRLIVGDVGYGKTEVGMRAAFQVVADSGQVAVLAPTTVLAFQHYQTFRQRFAAFPVRIEMLSRFRNAREQKEVLRALQAGEVDIVIGTHRLISRDVVFHNLGLLIVDEEQRFGVGHKERIKELRKDVDVLTLSATPIPRTLNMAMVGLRDMSMIETAPRNRLAIQTVVAPFQENLIQRAIQAELARQGQVFFVHNRVESIASLAAMVQRLVPAARIVVGHGQMKDAALESVMLKFVRGEADVLVSTVIIENGLDIPRANTIIINRADRMGLSELYQLRGRVGRSDQPAYAYLLIPAEGSLSSIARQRLAALKEFSELGAGFRIAALDLELRGAGNLLGREQHGHVGAVGFDLYCRMLERAVAQRKGEDVGPELHATLNLGLDIRIPPVYITSENLRMRVYRGIAGVTTEPEREELARELADRFGPLPSSVNNLLEYAVVKSLAEKLMLSSIERRGDDLALKFHQQTAVSPDHLVRIIRGRRDLRMDPSGILWLKWKQGPAGLVGSIKELLLQLQM
jgi:transcription-repair coupling factor (superfamily II helicase)